MTRFRRRRVLLQIGIAAPILAYASVGLAALTWPGFDHATQYLSELGATVEVYRNDAISVAEVAAMHPDRIVISPGPCTPSEAGISIA
ncbi:MAG: glutamine amidotransferase-related protein, partial [Phenylobacterium sp.]